ncbi:putative beta-lysine N-acetyltransferase [Pseudobacteroides cellulosolvens]|uniref:putative beta-lysine N-acetyltransferase n=1 Tax=Pseudobacteroides cellulosolvens TaxID=35825 RepID=UPI0030842880
MSDDIILSIVNLAKCENLGKIISNSRIKILKNFRNCGFSIEGVINGYFNGEDAYCVSYFLDKDREVHINKEEEDKILYQCLFQKKRNSETKNLKYTIRNAEPNDIPQMIQLFLNVFETYPSPVFNGDYLKTVMNKQILFKVAVENGRIISIASADMDANNMNAEVTDCATYPEHRGRGILTNLIHSLECDLKKKGFFTLYSLSRAINPGINKALSNLNYKYGGRLVNNCHICGGFEDMNIWVKKLRK